jgi:hypothetical protein
LTAQVMQTHRLEENKDDVRRAEAASRTDAVR